MLPRSDSWLITGLFSKKVIARSGITWQTRHAVLTPGYLAFTKPREEASGNHRTEVQERHLLKELHVTTAELQVTAFTQVFSVSCSPFIHVTDNSPAEHWGSSPAILLFSGDPERLRALPGTRPTVYNPLRTR